MNNLFRSKWTDEYANWAFAIGNTQLQWTKRYLIRYVFIAVEYATFPSTNISFNPSVGKMEKFSNRETEFWISIPHNF